MGAGIAQLVEHRLPKPRVAGSNPVARSKFFQEIILYLLFKNFFVYLKFKPSHKEEDISWQERNP
jgi:hypothetical protein